MLKQKVNNNNGIIIEDFEELCKIIDIDQETTKLILQEFQNKGLIIDAYKVENSHHR